MESNLSLEMKFFYMALFGMRPSKKLIQCYAQAHDDLIDLSDFDSAQIQTLMVILEQNLDPVGIEIWLRRKGKRHLLSVKLLLVSYLAESGGNIDCFVRNKHRSKFQLILCLIFSIFIFIRGYHQKYKYGLL
jgi:hypothetical protein